MGLNEHIAAYPLWVQIWLFILSATLVLALPFALKDWRARWILASMVVVVPLMGYLHSIYGFSRILGLAHIVMWTPLCIYLWRKRNDYPKRIWTRRYIHLALLILSISLLFDYADVIRFLMGDNKILRYS